MSEMQKTVFLFSITYKRGFRHLSERREIQVSDSTDQDGIELGKWMGRREAFGLMAGRCSAAEVESLRRIRDGNLYQKLGCTWEEFCSQHLHVTSRTVERDIAYLRRFGAAFFTLRQLARISVRDFTAIADRISEEGVHVDGRVVALLPENSEALAGALETLIERAEPPQPAAAPAAFDTVLQHFRSAAHRLRSFEGGMDHRQLRVLAGELADLLAAAAERGVTLGVR